MGRSVVLCLLSFLIVVCWYSFVLGQPVDPQPLPLDAVAEGQLGPDSPVRWYAITLDEPGALSVRAETKANLAIGLRLFDGNGTTVLQADTGGTTSVRIVGHAHLNPGSYFVSLQQASGSGGYTVRADYEQRSRPGDAAPGNSSTHGHRLDAAQSGSGLLGFYHNGRTDTDTWFAVTMEEAGLLRVEITADETLAIAAQLFDQNGTTSLHNNASGTTSTRIVEHPNLNPGTYYIHVRRTAGYGRYWAEPFAAIRSAAADVPPGNSREEAYAVSLSEERAGLLGFYGGGRTETEAWFEVRVNEPGHLKVVVEAEENLSIAAQLFDTNRTTSLHNNASGTASERTVEHQHLNPGTYVIHVRRTSGFGRYRVSAALDSASRPGDVQPDNSRETAYGLEWGVSTGGLLGFFSGGRTGASAWFQVDVTEPGALQIHAEADDTLQIAAQLFDSNGTTSLQNDSSGSQSVRAVGQANLNPGTYYIQIRRTDGFGRYAIEPSLSKAAAAMDRSPGNSLDTAHPLQILQQSTGLLGFYAGGQTDTDVWYSLETPEPGAIRVAVEADETLAIATQLFDQNGTTSLHSDASGTASSRELHYVNLNPGSYWVQIRRSSGYGRYTVQAAFLRPAGDSVRPPAPDFQGAPALLPGDKAAGRLGFHGGGDTDMRSWYRVPVAEDGPLLIHTTAEDTLRLAGRLHLDGRQLASDASGTRSWRWVQVEEAAAGDYGWELTRASGHGAYSVAVSRESSGFLMNPASFDFGSVEVGTASAAMHFALVNLGFTDQTGMTVQLVGDDAGEFPLLQDDISETTIASRGAHTVEVQFQPTCGGHKQAALLIQTAQETLTVPLAGTGYSGVGDPILETVGAAEAANEGVPEAETIVLPAEDPVTDEEPVSTEEAPVRETDADLSVMPRQHSFGTAAVGETSESITVLLINARPAPITVWELQWRGLDGSSFALTGPEIYESDLPANSSLPIPIAFAPQRTGVQWALLEIYTDSGVLHVPVQGIGE